MVRRLMRRSVSVCPRYTPKVQLHQYPWLSDHHRHPTQIFFLKSANGGIDSHKTPKIHIGAVNSTTVKPPSQRPARNMAQQPSTTHIAPPGGQRTSQKAQVVSADDRQTETLTRGRTQHTRGPRAGNQYTINAAAMHRDMTERHQRDPQKAEQFERPFGAVLVVQLRR